MARIRAKWGDLILKACHPSSIPPEFLSALVANESGGHPGTASRFEPQVFRHLLDVQAGKASPSDLLHHRPAHYGSITVADLRTRPESLIRAYATSWGLTQIMGYHVIGSSISVSDLVMDAINLRVAVSLLCGFCSHFNLAPEVEFEEMFRCWNTGQPHGKTFDPQYVENGLRRLVIYREDGPSPQRPQSGAERDLGA
jgi:hypothetical protein